MRTYDKAFFDQGIDRRNTHCEKWDGLTQRTSTDMLPMWVADMDFPCADEIMEAIQERAQHPVFGYTSYEKECGQALLNFMERRHGLKLPLETHAMLPCVITGLKTGVLSLTQPGDSVIIQPPVYGPFYSSVLDNGRKLSECPLLCDEHGYYTMDLAAVEEALKGGAKLMILCNPHNPVGRAWTVEELTALWQLLRQYDCALISDEIHMDFVLGKKPFVPILSVADGEDDRVVALTSASKTFNLAGLQQAAILCRNQEMLSAMKKQMNAAGVTQGNIFAMVACEAAHRFGDAWLDGLKDYLRQAVTIVQEELAKRLPKAVFMPMEATYLGWIDLRAYGFSHEELIRRTQEHGVFFSEGTFFGQEAGTGFMRINVACPHSHTIEAIKRLEAAIKA
ncbi:MAG: pyridoxal phosphate-dependent aminotransferase [Clostridia bacterium]|nr:pyridoxal phosphate-dependent aminotransferase [Clostridia bacterium]MBP3651343.1 pyridoxal phosphate-dependent aminotransferase [Clostridia bacterium]